MKSDSHPTGEDNLFTTPTSETYLEIPVRCLHCWAHSLTFQCNIIPELLQFCDETFHAAVFAHMMAESLTFDKSNI